MTPQQYQRIARWFEQYAGAFFNDDPFVNANLQLKVDHTRRVVGYMDQLTEAMSLDDSTRTLARTVALLHDVARFPQFVAFKTYMDGRSFNHGQRGAEILQEEAILTELTNQEQATIRQAIRLHSVRVLPAELTGLARQLTQWVRDADKLDIMDVMIQKFREYQQDPDNFMLEVEFPDTPEYTPAIYQAVLNEQQVRYDDLKTLNDLRLLNLSWVFDMNVPASLAIARKKGFIHAIAHYLPDDEPIATLLRHIDDYISGQLDQPPLS